MQQHSREDNYLYKKKKSKNSNAVSFETFKFFFQKLALKILKN